MRSLFLAIDLIVPLSGIPLSYAILKAGAESYIAVSDAPLGVRIPS